MTSFPRVENGEVCYWFYAAEILITSYKILRVSRALVPVRATRKCASGCSLKQSLNLIRSHISVDSLFFVLYRESRIYKNGVYIYARSVNEPFCLSLMQSIQLTRLYIYGRLNLHSYYLAVGETVGLILARDIIVSTNSNATCKICACAFST